ncbi:MAG: alkaline phosphatase family protein [Rhodospirillales bacterium]
MTTNKRAVLVICDGLRADMVTPEWTPNLWRLKDRFRFYGNHRSVFPSTTRTTAASIATGCHPARHGLEGNCMALDEGQGLEVISVGPPGFRDRLEKAKGRTLKVPTLAERVKDVGGAMVYSNVSPGAAMFHDPDGHGFIYHRSFSQGPGRSALDPLGTEHTAAGDTDLTDRFLADVLIPGGPAYSLIWQCEPDHTQHAVALGSPEHLAVIAAADANAGRIADRVEELDPTGENILLIIGSDHGHETVTETVDLDAMLVKAGLKDSADSRDVAVASQGTSATIYLSAEAMEREGAIVEFLRADARFGGVVNGADLALIGMPVDEGPRIAVTGAVTDAVNEYGVAGGSVAIQGTLKISINDNCGQHGGLGPREQNPFAMARGAGFAGGSECQDPTSAVDIAPTILRHLGQGHSDMDGAPLP